jgi:hypothetical protein
MSSASLSLSDGARQRFLLRELVSGSQEAFSRLYDDFSAETYAICLGYLPDAERAQYAMHCLWLYIWQNAEMLAAYEWTPAATILATADHHARFHARDRDAPQPLARVS